MQAYVYTLFGALVLFFISSLSLTNCLVIFVFKIFGDVCFPLLNCLLNSNDKSNNNRSAMKMFDKR